MKKKQPKTLQEAIIYFADEDNAIEYLHCRRWPDGNATCPTCRSDDVRYIATRRLWECKAKHAKRQFSIKAGTIFEGSPIKLSKWMCAVWMLTNCKNGVSSYEIHRALGVTQKTAWFMLQRIRLAMQDEDDGGTLGDEVEVDETFIGGKARNMHKDKRAKKITGTGGKDKTIVSECSNVADALRLESLTAASAMNSTRRFGSTSRPDRRSSATNWSLTTDWRPTMNTQSSIMLSST